MLRSASVNPTALIAGDPKRHPLLQSDPPSDVILRVQAPRIEFACGLAGPVHNLKVSNRVVQITDFFPSAGADGRAGNGWLDGLGLHDSSAAGGFRNLTGNHPGERYCLVLRFRPTPSREPM